MESRLTDPDYWSRSWSGPNLPANTDPNKDPKVRDLCRFLQEVLVGRSGQLLEIGCGGSRFLPYFSRLGFRVSGIDYSAIGCQQARMILDREGIPGDIYEGDAFDENPSLVGRYDVVVSFGVIEHFLDTAEAVRAFSRYLKPQGAMISTCPNLAGLLGLGQRILNRSVYDRHIALTAEALRKAHEAAGLTVTHCEYLGSLDFHALNLQGVERLDKELAYRVLTRLSRISWKLPFHVEPNRFLSSTIACAACAS